MSLQWTIVATFLYVELAFVILLLLPIISVSAWNRFFKSKFLKSLSSQAHIYFYGFLIVLVLLFVDSIREMKRYSIGREQDSEHGHLDAELQHSMKLFRAQRNFYIAGFALFLYLVIRRLVLLINAYALAIADQKASLKQAQNAGEALKNYLGDEKSSSDKNKKGEKSNDNVQNEIKNLQLELKNSKDELKKLQTIKTQSENITKEYDRLMKEHEKLQKSYEKATNSGQSKKDN